MTTPGRALSWIGGNGPVLLLVALTLGIAAKPLGDAGHRLLPLSAFLLTLGSFLTAGLSASEENVSPRIVAVILIWVGVAVPTAAAAAVSCVKLDPALRTGVLLSLLSPPVGSAAAIAAMIDLRARLALVVSISLTLLAPLTMPAFAVMMGLDISFDVGSLAGRLFAIIGLAALMAWLILRFHRRVEFIVPDKRAATGVAVLGLVVVGLAMAHGVGEIWRADRVLFSDLMTAAIAANFGICLLTFLIFASLGIKLAGTIGLVSGNRNVTLAWAAASTSLPTLAEGYVAACVVPVLLLPFLTKVSLFLVAGVKRMRPYPQGGLLKPTATGPAVTDNTCSWPSRSSTEGNS
jgi:predicted Na+-dependent transporter